MSHTRRDGVCILYSRLLLLLCIAQLLDGSSDTGFVPAARTRGLAGIL